MMAGIAELGGVADPEQGLDSPHQEFRTPWNGRNSRVVLLCATVYAWSTWWCGRLLEQQPL